MKGGYFSKFSSWVPLEISLRNKEDRRNNWISHMKRQKSKGSFCYLCTLDDKWAHYKNVKCHGTVTPIDIKSRISSLYLIVCLVGYSKDYSLRTITMQPSPTNDSICAQLEHLFEIK